MLEEGEISAIQGDRYSVICPLFLPQPENILSPCACCKARLRKISANTPLEILSGECNSEQSGVRGMLSPITCFNIVSIQVVFLWVSMDLEELS